MTITEFLLARIAEDEEAASLVHSSVAEYHVGWTADGMFNPDSARLGALWNGDRVLAECAAKRVAVEWYLNDDDTVMAATIKALAAVYADHADYRDEWRP